MSPGKFALVWAASCTTLWGAILGVAARAPRPALASSPDLVAEPDTALPAGARAAPASASGEAGSLGAGPNGAAALSGNAAVAADAGALTPSSPSRPREPVWRIATLAHDPEIQTTPGTIGKRTFLAAMTASGLSTKDGFRLLKAFAGVRQFERCSPHDVFTVARDRVSRKLVAFEYSTSPLEVWQARAGDDGELAAKKLDFDVSTKRDDVAIVVGEDLRSSVEKAGLDDDLLTTLEDALEGHAELSDLRPGARLRVIATESRVEGAFAGFSSVDAVEYFPASAGVPPVRVYKFPDGAPGGESDARASGGDKKDTRVGYFDAKGRQPYRGGWRTPVPLARISSRFNPRRMHPVLHVIKPHNGVDFAAPAGTPVYAAATGTVKIAGDGGPCGNMVQITHVTGLVTAYCHLSRFAPGLHAGDHVDGRQLIGYVGQTGRATGPHLHFALKKGSAFLDPLGLKLDGVRVVPPGDRDAFDRQRAALDTELDSIPLPPAPAVTTPMLEDDGGAPQDMPEGEGELPDESN